MNSRDPDDSGYVLASALVALIVIAIIVTSLLTVSLQELSRVKRLERDVVIQTYLEGRLVEMAAAITSDGFNGSLGTSSHLPASLMLENERLFFGIEEHKVDVNLSQRSVILEAGRAADIPEAELVFALEQLARLRADGQSVRLVDDVVPPESLRPECFHRIFTVFGGSTNVDLENTRPVEHSLAVSLAPGARVWVAVSAVDSLGTTGRYGVFLVTGDTNARVIWLDSRPTRMGFECHET